MALMGCTCACTASMWTKKTSGREKPRGSPTNGSEGHHEGYSEFSCAASVRSGQGEARQRDAEKKQRSSSSESLLRRRRLSLLQIRRILFVTNFLRLLLVVVGVGDG